ncbi:MAG: hypothetical protein RLZZ77_671 [Bacteroidota bacterium]|jgi:outer membrane biosynthesis protein TonB
MTTAPSKDKNVALIGTIGIHGLGLVLMLLLMRSCDGSGPGTGGGSGGGETYMALNIAALGELDGGMTDAPPDNGAPPEASPQPESTPSSQDNIVSETNSAVNVKSDPKNNNTKPNPNPKPNPDPKPTAAESIIKNDKNNPNKKPGGPPNGNPVPQGNPNGVITGKGVLSGAGGGGNGSGYEYAFTRPMTAKPKLNEEIRVAGTITINVTVDKNGKVISASPISSSYIPDNGGSYSRSEVERLAIIAAKSTVFEPDPSATIPKTGKITITLKMK